jgi:iron complex outermembrane receptor protein
MLVSPVKFYTAFLFLLLGKLTIAQDTTFLKELPLKDVVVTAFNSSVKWKETPTAVSIIKKSDFLKFSPASILPAMNLVPGVRMEERSPGSFRLSVRGSLLRSPFGIRNVKVYWNEIPFSDATGNTYLNLLDPLSIDKVEIAKGPGSSMYGAGTGGVFLYNQDPVFSTEKKQRIAFAITGGSYGYNQQQIQLINSNAKISSVLQLHRLQSAGYRENSALNRTGLFWQTGYQSNKHSIKTTLFYTHLNYETPGGITQAQMLLNPQLSRQATATLPSAIAQKASIQNNTFWAGIHDQYQVNAQLVLKSFIAINRTNFTNPFITNYETRKELNLSGGIQWIYKPANGIKNLQWVTGVEYLVNESSINNYFNNRGVAGTIQASDIVYTKQGFVFTQLSLKPIRGLMIHAGISLNQQKYQYKSFLVLNESFNIRNIQSPISPRISINYAINNELNFYGILSRGFSAPSLAEIRPSDGNFYPLLNAEQGWNAEIGIKGSLMNNQLLLDLNYYSFNLKDAIVRRNDLNGNEFFVNAGSTKQNGVELMLKYQFVAPLSIKKWRIDFMHSFSYQPYKFTNFQQGNTVFTGNPITGVPKFIGVSSLDYKHNSGWSFNLTANFTSKLSLNDAATVYAAGYELLQAKLSKQIKWRHYPIQLFVGVDNLLNQTYSLGNDINAVGNRFFNPAPLRNSYMGVRINFQ